MFPEKESTGVLKSFVNFWYMTFYMLSRRSGKLGTLVDKNVKPKNPPVFKFIEFDKSETKLIEKNAWSSGARIGQSAFYIAATAQVVNTVLTERGKKPPYLWFSVPHNQRRRGSAGHLVSNQLSFLFFKLRTEDLSNSKTAVSVLTEQLKQQIKTRIAERYVNLLNALKLMPMSIYEGMVDLASNGKVSSFGYSDLGEDKLRLSDFLGAPIEKMHHYPPVPCPPGFNVAVIKSEQRAKFVWAYFDESVSEQEANLMEKQFRDTLLKTSDQ